MSQIFISYAREDRERIQPLAECLERHGWTVFWDRKIQTGQSWHAVISAALEQAERVIVAWSDASLASDFVRDEAAAAQERRILVPILLDHVTPPLGFRQIQAADFADWHGEEDSPALEQLLKDLGAPPAARDASLPAAAITSTATRAQAGPGKHSLLPYAVGAVGLIAGGIALFVARSGGGRSDELPHAGATSATARPSATTAATSPTPPDTAPVPSVSPPDPLSERQKVEATLSAYYSDVNAGTFVAERYFAPRVTRFINFENVPRGRIDRYFKSELPKMYGDYKAEMQKDSLVKGKAPRVFTYRELAKFTDNTQAGKPRSLPAMVRIEVDDDAKIVSFEQILIKK